MSARLICFDTETTGLDFSAGDRVIEIGCVEILGREKTGNEFQTYINPEGKEISQEAQEITNILGISGYDRTHHGALLDAQILADTYLNLTGGQVTFDLAENAPNQNTKEDESQVNNLEFIKFSSNNTDETEHNKFIEMMAQRNEKEANR